MRTAKKEAYLKLNELNLVAPVYKKVVAQGSMYVACHTYKLDPLTTKSGMLYVILRGDSGLTIENGSPVYHSWDKMVNHINEMITRQRNFIHENSHYACCEGWGKIAFDIIPSYMKEFESRLNQHPEVKEDLEKVDGVWQTKETYLDMSEEMKEKEDKLRRLLGAEYASTYVAIV